MYLYLASFQVFKYQLISIYHISKNASNDYLGLRYVDPRWVTLEGFTNATSEAPAPVPPVEVGSPLFTKVSYIPGGCLGFLPSTVVFKLEGAVYMDSAKFDFQQNEHT